MNRARLLDTPPAALDFHSDLAPLDSKKKAIVMLRWLLVIAAAYVMVFNGHGARALGVVVVVLLLIASNVVIRWLPEALVERSAFDLAILVVDTLLLSAGFYFTESISSDFYLLYFFVIFVAGVSEKLTAVLMGSVLASVAYLSLAWPNWAAAHQSVLQGNLPLRLFFIFAVALFYGFLVERIRVDRARRQADYVARLEGVNAKLRELVELKQAFVSAVSHELRTPLNAMLGYVELMRDGTAGAVRGMVRTYLDQAHRQGTQLLRLIEQLLSFAHLSSGRMPVQLAEADVCDVIEQVRADFEPKAAAKGLGVQVEVQPDLGRVVTDANKLRQILLQLADNAIKFTDQGEVRMTVSHRDAVLSSGWRGIVLECAVSDTGPGIKPEHREVIFEDFRQLDGSLTRAHGGMGLGLSVCRGLVQLLHGDIFLDSAVGKGTCFTVRLPLKATMPVAPTEPFAPGITAMCGPPANRISSAMR